MGPRSGARRRPLLVMADHCKFDLSDGVSAGSPVNRSRFAMTAADRLRILEAYKRIAMVGLSSNPFRPSHFAAIYLLSAGYDVVPVNPRESQVLGQKSYPSLRDVPEPI